MDTTAQKILSIVETRGPIKASDIAKITGLERREINQYLYYKLNSFCVQNENYEWLALSNTDESEAHNSTPRHTSTQQSEDSTSHFKFQDTNENNQFGEDPATMSEYKKIDRWADKLLDTGKRNNLMNFRDSKASTAEVVFPDCEKVFSKCTLGHVFEVYDPKIQVDDIDEEGNIQLKIVETEEKLNKDNF